MACYAAAVTTSSDCCCAAKSACRCVLAQLLNVEPDQLQHTFLRFERLSRLVQALPATATLLASRHANAGHKIGVFVTWDTDFLALGFANRVLLLEPAQSLALKDACRRGQLRYVDNT